jgi:peptide/nickel transport system permease protein
MTQPSSPHDIAEPPGGGVAVSVEEMDELSTGGLAGKTIVGRSPGQLAWMRLKRDRVALVCAIVLAFLILLAIIAPLIRIAYGKSPTDQNSTLLNSYGFPLGYLGGISGEHWLGVEPGLGRDLMMQLIYGMRTSMIVAFVGATLAVAIGVLVGVVAGYAGGKVDAALNWVIDLVLAFPFLIFCLAIIPVLNTTFFGPAGVAPAVFRVGVIILVFTFFSWTYPARLVRGQVLSLREREFVEAARAAGAGTGYILFRQLLPNIWAPVLVVFSLTVPQFITAEAALSFLNIGVVEPTPDLGRLLFDSVQYLQSDPMYTLFPGALIFILVLSFNLLGDSLRDALDPKSSR